MKINEEEMNHIVHELIYWISAINGIPVYTNEKHCIIATISADGLVDMKYNWVEIKKDDFSNGGISLQKSINNSVMKNLIDTHPYGKIKTVYYLQDDSIITEAYLVTDEHGFYITMIDAVNGQIIEL